jgi:L-glutamine-phosphate cytidylyltransferase
MTMPTVILAAGCGKRMGPEGRVKPKTLFPVAGAPIIDHIMGSLQNAGITDCVVATGHKAGMLAEYMQKKFTFCSLTFVENEKYETTNNIYSLWLARDYLQQGFYLAEADVCCDRRLMAAMAAAPHPDCMAVDLFRPPMNGATVSLLPSGIVEGMYPSPAAAAAGAILFKTVNVYKCSADYSREHFLPGLARHIAAGNVNLYYETVIREDIQRGIRFFGFKMENLPWWEIDTPEDAALAERLFTKPHHAAGIL